MNRYNSDSPETKPGGNLKFLVSTALASLIFVGIIAVAVFFIAVKGAEQTLVPDVEGKELIEALLALQVKELYPRIQLRYSQTSADKGKILEQEPKAGTIVKAGRRIRLVISQGVMLNRVENYIGRNIDEVRIDIQAFTVSSGSQLIKIKEPLLYDFSPETPGTILQQKPEPGTDISGPMELELVVSRGPDNSYITVPQFDGLTLSSALEQIGRTGIAFAFSLRERDEGESGGTVVSQNPPAGTNISSNTPVDLVVSFPPSLNDGEVFKLFIYTLPQNPYPLPVRLEAVLPSGEKEILFGVNSRGGRFTVPYRLPVNSTLILTLMERELYRETVRY